MSDLVACELPADLKEHVYVLFSSLRPDLVKVGRSKSATRIHSLRKMHYGDVTDWSPLCVVSLDTRHTAIAVEAMAHARLAAEGFLVPSFRWTRLPDQKSCLANECFSCCPHYAVSVVKEMAQFINEHVLQMSANNSFKPMPLRGSA
ncbi:GIY-YIG nuclease family protein [Xanthomonas arboricola]